MTRAVRIVALSVLGLLPGPFAAAQDVTPSDVAALNLEDLLKFEVVSVASRFPQEVREAPASITVVSAQDIRRNGHRTLADVLRSVRGVYITYDRNYTYVGIRGFSRPGDYNTRVLLLVDGHRLNDQVYDMAPIATEFPIDVSLIDRVAVIRGPASSLYGTNAFLAVINVVTRTGAQHAGLRAEAVSGALGTVGGTLSFGHAFRGGDLLLAASAQRAHGADRLYYPEFDNGEPGSGTAVGLDDDESANVFGSVSFGRISMRAGAGRRTKDVPTAAFGTLFGDASHLTIDERVYIDAEFDGRIGKGWTGVARAAFDYYSYKGFYPYDYGEPEAVVFRDLNDSRTIAGELTARRRLGRRHLFSAGGEVRRQFRNYMFAGDKYETSLDLDVPGTVVGAYVQDEVRLFPWLLANAGLRLDRYDSFGSHLTPRAALVFLPRPATSVKLLRGHAFRAPNKYELFYYNGMRDMGFTLEPERVRSTEIVWEEFVSSRFRTSLTAFIYEADSIIEQRSFEAGGGDDLYFANAGRARGRGIEAEIEARLPRGMSAHVGHTYARVRDVVQERQFSNSPRHLSKFGAQVPLSELWFAVEGQYVGRRLSVAGEPIDGYFAPNATLSSSPTRRIELAVSVYNAFNVSYSHPGAEEHVQQAIEQDGRTALARVRVRF